MRRRLIGSIAALTMIVTMVSIPARAAATVYKVGASVRGIDPDVAGSPLAPGTPVRVGGNGLGDGSSAVSQAIGAAGKRAVAGEHISARAVVIDDGTTAVAFTTVETQGMFAAYQRGLPGLHDIAVDASNRIAASGGNLPADNIVISNDHTHSGPDMIGAWGFVPDEYARFIASQTTDAIVAAYAARQDATITSGADYTPDLIYNMTCTEALNQGASDTYPNTVCSPFEDQKDSWLRVMQARATADNSVITTVMAYAAHATEGGGNGLHGDWPQFMSDKMSATYGGIGIAFEGAVGRTQPCRPRCGFTDHSTPGYELSDRKAAYTTMLYYHVQRALLNAPAVAGSIAAARTYIRHEVSNPGLLMLTQHGELIGAPIARSLDKPWTVGNTVRTPVTAIKLGNILINGAPGEAYPNIPMGVSEATNVPIARKWTLGLADDQLGYLMSPVEGWAPIAAQAGVNDNALFNISPTVGDHVMCAQIRLSAEVGFPVVRTDPHCPAWDTVDSAGDPLGE